MNHMSVAPSLLTIGEYHAEARKKLPQMYYDYYRSGADDMITLNWNQSDFQKLKIRPRMLIDVSHIDTSIQLLNNKNMVIDFPVMIAPTAMHKLANTEGELATARAAAKMGTVFTLSSLSTSSIKDVAAQKTCSAHHQWFQLYITKNRKLTEQLVRSAEQNGYTALVLTVDAPKLGNRIADHHNKFHLPEGMSLVNLMDALKQVGEDTEQKKQTSALNQYFQTQIDDSLTWKDVQWLKTITRLPILVKGILTAEDAFLAVENGVDGIIVSNHGARQVDTTISTIEALPEIAETVRRLGAQDRVDIYLDGGIQHGTDVIKALALGAKAVFIGRAALWGLSVSGEQGVMDVLSILKKEFILAMQLCGCKDIRSVTPALLATTHSRL